jgi:hypothetical protein
MVVTLPNIVAYKSAFKIDKNDGKRADIKEKLKLEIKYYSQVT